MICKMNMNNEHIYTIQMMFTMCYKSWIIYVYKTVSIYGDMQYTHIIQTLRLHLTDMYIIHQCWAIYHILWWNKCPATKQKLDQ